MLTAVRRSHRTWLLCSITEFCEVGHVMKYSKIVVPRLVRARESKKLSRKQLAYALGMSAARLGRIERGDIDLTLDDTIRICVALDEPVAGILYGGEPGVINISNHWPRNQKLIHQLLSTLRMFEEHVEAQWAVYCDGVLEPHYTKALSEKAKVKKRPKPPWKIKDL